MDRKIVCLVLLAVLASGCTLPDNGPKDNGGGDDGPELAQDRGLRIEAFRMTDETLRPSQPAILNLRLKNYHTSDINVTEVDIYNEGLLTVENRTCNPSIGDLAPAAGNTYPEMKCQWDVEAPPKSAYGSFESKPASLNLQLRYDSVLKNHNPFKVEFKPLEEINQTSDISQTISNSEVSMKVSTEEPVPTSSTRTVVVETKEIGKGRLETGTNYSFKFEPNSLFTGCERETAPVVGKEVEFSCDLGDSSSSTRGTRNLIFSTSYKYIKEPVLNIKLVNEQ